MRKTFGKTWRTELREYCKQRAAEWNMDLKMEWKENLKKKTQRSIMADKKDP